MPQDRVFVTSLASWDDRDDQKGNERASFTFIRDPEIEELEPKE